ncbi:MAG: hypothetical protein O3A00_28985, partial [Planctomycetota bacterium]|nr:hypothetical protein [Planctomycetota bacterium]
FFPGLIFWYALFAREETVVDYRVVLRGRGKDTVVCRCGEEFMNDAERVATMIHQATGLPLEKDFAY